MLDLKGKQFGRLLVIKQIGKNKWGSFYWLCRCSCKDGNEIIIPSGNLRNGHTKSCGCLRKETTIQRSIKHNHGKSGEQSKIYLIWKSMRQRCTNPNNKDYKDYGERGIKICERWMEFPNFLEDMGEPPEGHQIDRINNNKNYCKSNCRWATPKQQARNRQNNRLIEFNEKTQCLSGWAEELNINRGTIEWRLNHGWSIEKALTTPVKNVV